MSTIQRIQPSLIPAYHITCPLCKNVYRFANYNVEEDGISILTSKNGDCIVSTKYCVFCAHCGKKLPVVIDELK